MKNVVFRTKKQQHNNKTKQNKKHNNPCQSRESNPVVIASQSDALR